MADEDIEEIADKFAGKFDAITSSTLYDKNAILQRDLKLSQAMCLLWQNSTTGEVAGRNNDLHLLVGIYCAGLLDLLLLDTYTVNDMLSTCLCLVSKKKIIEVSAYGLSLLSRTSQFMTCRIFAALGGFCVYNHKRGFMNRWFIFVFNINHVVN